MRRYSVGPGVSASKQSLSTPKPFSPDVSEDLPHAMRLLRARLQGNVPRVLGPASFESWSTDASYEPDGTGGIGGVLARPDGSIFA